MEDVTGEATLCPACGADLTIDRATPITRRPTKRKYRFQTLATLPNRSGAESLVDYLLENGVSARLQSVDRDPSRESQEILVLFDQLETAQSLTAEFEGKGEDREG